MPRMIRSCGLRLLVATLSFSLCAVVSAAAEPQWITVDDTAPAADRTTEYATMWERWNSYTAKDGFGKAGMNSFNHYAYGAVLGWMYSTMAGIRADEKGGWKRFTLAPHPDPRVGSVTAAYKTDHGVIRSAWNYGVDGAWRWSFTIPEGTAATVVLPDGAARVYKPGSYTKEYRLRRSEALVRRFVQK